MHDAEVTRSLRKIREIFSNEKKWTKYAFARDSDNKGCKPLDDYAESFCLAGAINRVSNYQDNLNSKLRALFCKRIKSECIVEWNDNPETKYNDLVNLINDVIKDSEKN